MQIDTFSISFTHHFMLKDEEGKFTKPNEDKEIGLFIGQVKYQNGATERFEGLPMSKKDVTNDHYLNFAGAITIAASVN